VLTAVVMVLLAWLVERFMLRKLVNQPAITLFMATIGLSYLIEGVAQGMWGRWCVGWIWASPTSR